MTLHNSSLISAYKKKYIILPNNMILGTFSNGIDFLGCYITEDYVENSLMLKLYEQIVMNKETFGTLEPSKIIVSETLEPLNPVQTNISNKPIWWNRFVKILIHRAQKINRRNSKKQRLAKDRLVKDRLEDEQKRLDKERLEDEKCLLRDRLDAEQILKAEKEKKRIRNMLEEHILIQIFRLNAKKLAKAKEELLKAKAEKERLKEKAKKLAKKEQKVLELENTLMSKEDMSSNKHRIFFKDTLEKIPFEDGLILKIFKDFCLDPNFLCSKLENRSFDDEQKWYACCEIMYILNRLIKIIFYCYLRDNRYIKIPLNLCFDLIHVSKIIIYDKISAKNKDVLKLVRPSDLDIKLCFRPFISSITDLYLYAYNFIIQREMPINVLEQVSLELSLYVYSKIFDDKGSLKRSYLLRKKYPEEVFQSLVTLAKAN